MERTSRSSPIVSLWLMLLLLLPAAPLPAQSETNKQDDQRLRIAYYVPVVPKGSAEKAMTAYHKWSKENPRAVPLDGKTPFAELSPAQQKSVRDLMNKMYSAAGDGAKGFKHVALILDKGLITEPSAKFKKEVGAGEAFTRKLPNELSILMAEARDYWIEETIRQVAEARSKKGKKIKVCRSDSGNTTSGMKSDIDQTFYVYEWDAENERWVRPEPISEARKADAEFIREFEAKWRAEFGPLNLGRLDIASIAGANRFPDVRVTDVDAASHAKKVRQTIVELRLTPGAYTTYGAVLQQMQLRALGGILDATKNPDDQGKRRAFQQYTDQGKVVYDEQGKLLGFDDQLALRTMFGAGMDPKIRHGLAFGAAVANFIELQHYMNDPKFETKYHLRTWDDAEFTHRLIEQQADAKSKTDYTDMSDAERARHNQEVLNRLFPDDAAAQRRHALAMDASAALRNVHKGKAGAIPELASHFEGVDPKDAEKMAAANDRIPPQVKNKAVFEKLSRELFPNEWKQIDADGGPKDRIDKLITDAEQQHRVLASEFCMRSICENSREMLGLMFELDSDKPLTIDPEKLRSAVQGDVKIPFSQQHHDAQWDKIKQNLQAEARETMLFSFYDLGAEQGQKLKDFLVKEHPHLAEQIKTLYENSKRSGWEAFKEFKGAYARYYTNKVGAKLSHLNAQVHRNVLMQLGFDGVEKMLHPGRWMNLQGTTWHFSKFARSAIWDPGSLDAGAQILRSVYESGGDIDVVMGRIIDEMFLAIPVVGQIESVRRGGYFAAGMMVVAMQVPQVGVVMVAYSMGQAYYAIYDMEYERPKRENVVDAVFRGFTGPERIEYGLPGQLPPVWNDEDEKTLSKLQNQVQHLKTQAANMAMALNAQRAEEIRKPIPGMEKRIDELLEARAAFRQYRDEDANWYGGLVTGEGAFNEYHELKHHILADVKPQIAFLTRGTIDRRVLDTYDASKHRSEQARLVAAQQNEKDVLGALKASTDLHELNLLKRRAEETSDLLERMKDTPELRYRFKRDSLYLYLRDQTQGNTTDQSLDRWVFQWYRTHEAAIIEELISIKLLDSSARTWRETAQAAVVQANQDRLANARSGVASPLSAADTKAIFDKHRPVNLDLLKQRVRIEAGRSRRLFAAHQKLEEDRKAKVQDNLKKAQAMYGREMSRRGKAELEVEGGIRNLIAGARYFSVPRHAPKVEMTVYKVQPGGADDGLPPAYQPEEALKNMYISADITVDPSLYMPPYKVVPTLIPINVQAKTLGASSVPLLPATKATLDTLLPRLWRKRGEAQHNTWLRDLPIISQGDKDWSVVLLSAYAADMADLKHAMPETVKHLPKVKTGQGYLMDQAVWFIQAPPPPITLAGTWGCYQGFGTGPLRFHIEDGEDGKIKAKLRAVSPYHSLDEVKATGDRSLLRAYRYRVLHAEFEGVRTGVASFKAYGPGELRGVKSIFHIQGLRHTNSKGVNGINFHAHAVSGMDLEKAKKYPIVYWKHRARGFFTPRSNYDDKEFSEEDRVKNQ